MKKIKFYKKRLKNGMTVILEERESSGVVSVAFAVRHGGIHEDKKEKGISHFIEHMLYKGTKNRTSKQISEEIEKNGGILNGFTEEELTAYWCKMPSSKIQIALEVLSDMILNPSFNEEELNKERKVILEELKMRKDMPNYYVLDKIQSLLYTGNLSLDIIGTVNSLKSITREKIIEKFKEVYATKNLILCVVGEANFKDLCTFCEKNFPKTSGKIKEPKIGLKNGNKIEKRKGIDQVNLILANHMPKASGEEKYAAHLLSCVLAGGMSSRLWQEIREKRNLAYAIKGSYIGGKRFGYNLVFVGTSPEKIQEVKRIILNEFKKIKKELGEKELKEVKEQLIGNSKISKEDSQGQMLDLLYNEITGDAKQAYDFEKKIKVVKLDDVKKLADVKKYSFIALIPE